MFRETDLEARATFLETIAQNILDIGDELIERCVTESGLPRGRIEGERGRTVGQLRLFAEVVREGSFVEARIDPAMPERKPAPRVDLRLRNIAVGPVAVFGASNFPLAFSVAGGDTASALAAGCPVVVKAHSAHPGTSELVGLAVQKAVKACGLPEGVFSMLFGTGLEIGQGLVADPRIKAVGFTGSRRGGTALMKVAAERPEPIPVYAEMSSINPVVLFPGALAATRRSDRQGLRRVADHGRRPVLHQSRPDPRDRRRRPGELRKGASAALGEAPAATMLTPGIHEAYCEGVKRLDGHAKVEKLAEGKVGERFQGQAALFSTPAADFLADPELQEEVFGSSSLIVRCEDEAELPKVLEAFEGQLTIALHMEEADHDDARKLLPVLETKAGRILVNGFGTGVEVAHAMVHGGPYPATSDGRSTSVGTLAITRFLRPVCYQDMPDALLPKALQEDNPLGIPRRIDGKRS